MEAVIAVLALLFVLFVTLGVYATVKAVGAARRSADRHITQARRTVEDHTLKVKSFAQPGPAGEIAQLRLKLRTSMRATQDALQSGASEDQSLKESLGLFERLSAHGHELDAELRRLESEPDRGTLAGRLPELRERTHRIARSADSLRWAARDRARHFAEDDLDSLSTQIDVETGALRHWTTTDPQSAPASAPASGPAHGAPAADRTGPEASRSEAVREPAPEPAQPSIAPAAPRPTYPWQKKPRPESTT
ncbi:MULTISPECIES: hypothetical protein [unclassified Streptomyces]|uniref:hypothetical protein n=2 Tax=Streptomyces TaxID=1883 RepID=UPI0005A7B510|nr:MULTISPECIES: hypothetical protein [unclassified Streptomyces]ODA74128.1 hypothetical protein APS67_001675 [Streptomyces sp. AVP053U2]